MGAGYPATDFSILCIRFRYRFGEKTAGYPVSGGETAGYPEIDQILDEIRIPVILWRNNFFECWNENEIIIEIVNRNTT